MRSDEEIVRAIRGIEETLDTKKRAVEKSECDCCGKSNFATTEPMFADPRARAIRDTLEWVLGEEEKVTIGTLERVLCEDGSVE